MQSPCFFVLLCMVRFCFILFVLSVGFISYAQDIVLPEDLRQHNVTQYNASLLNPVFSLDRNNPESIALWTRWQWQSIDSDPSTLFLNYTGRLNTNSAIGVGFFQHNTGTYMHTGGVVNYAHSFDLGSDTWLAIGANVLGFQRKIADERFQPDSLVQSPPLERSNSFIVQLAPGIRFTIDKFSIGIASENLFDYNFSTNKRETHSSDKVYIGMVAYDFPVALFGNVENSSLQPTVYIKTLPHHDTQYGVSTLLSNSKFWAQAGYNSFYGISGGIGGRFFKKLSLGALVEFGTGSSLDNKDPSFEIVTAYHFGKPDQRKKVVGFDVGEEDEVKALQEKEKAAKEDLAKTEALAAEKVSKKKEGQTRAEKESKYQDSIAIVRKKQALAAAKIQEEQKRADSLDKARIAQITMAKKKAELDRIAQQEKTAQPKTKGHYEEVASVEGLASGYYLIANVFGTKKYHDKFIQTLKAKGLQPKSFYRSINKYNYVYLERYGTLQEAEKARVDHFNGRYPDKTWIFRVIGN